MERIPFVAVLTVSDRSYLALREDRSGALLAERVRGWGWNLVAADLVPDDPAAIGERLRKWAQAGVDLILTTGGTGLAPRDCVPEATIEVADRFVPGIQEWTRSRSGHHNPHSFLSRGVAVMRGHTLIINLPGSPRAVTEYLDALEFILPHALDQAASRPHWGNADQHP